MKKIGNIQIAELMFRPSVYTFDDISYRLIFNRGLCKDDIIKVISEIGKEASSILQVRRLASAVGTDRALRELAQAESLVADLTEIYNNIDKYADAIATGSGKITVRNTTIAFSKPRVVEFQDVQDKK